MSAAFDFLTAACRAWLGTGPVGRVLALEVEESDLAELALVHGLEPLLFRLGERGVVDARTIPPALKERWERAYFQHHVFNTEALERLGRLQTALGAAEVDTLVFKGPATAARGYGEPGLRPMVDLDLLCREDDLGEIVEAARGEGFVGGEEDSVYHLTLGHQELGLSLELHFDLYDFVPRRRELLERLLSGTVELELAGRRFRAAPPAAALLLDVAHLVNHDFRVGLKPLLDLAVQARRAPEPPSGKRLAREAAVFGLEPELALAAALVERLFAVRLPDTADIAEAAGVDLAGEVAGLEAALRAPSAARPALAEAGARPGWGGKARYLARLLLPPSRRLEAAADSDIGPLALRKRHLGARLRSALGRRRLWGGASEAAAAASIKRRVYERRARERQDGKRRAH